MSYSTIRKIFRKGDTVIRPGIATAYRVVESEPQSRDRIVCEDMITGEVTRFSQYAVHRATTANLKIIGEYNQMMDELR